MLHLVLAATMQAQAHFNAGLADLFAYASRESAAEFIAAEKADPTFALAYWGEALADGSDINTPLTLEHFQASQAAIKKAQPYLAGLSERDNALVSAAMQRYAGTFEQHDRDEAEYRTAMRAYVAAHPEDDDAAMFLAEALMEQHSASAEVVTLIKRTLQHAPLHLFANHLCIHAYDDAPDRTFAITCAQTLDAMAFQEPMEHLAHMPAHTWIEIGDGKAALASSERAWALNPTRYALHDAIVAYSAAWMCGDQEGIARWVQRIGALIGRPFTQPLPQDLVAAQRSEAAGKIDQAIALLQKAAASLTNAGENIPPFPADVRIGAVYYRAGRFTDARDAFLAVLKARPRDPRALFGAAETFDRLGDPSQATRYRELFTRYWSGGPLTIRDF